MTEIIRPDRISGEKTEIVKLQQKELRLSGSITLFRGEKLFSFNVESHQLTEVDPVRQVMVDVNGNPIKKSKAMHNPNCIYVKALNQKNAIRKLSNFLGVKLSYKPVKQQNTTDHEQASGSERS